MTDSSKAIHPPEAPADDEAILPVEGQTDPDMISETTSDEAL